MRPANFAEKLLTPSGPIKTAAVFMLLAMMCGSTALVWFTGGIKFVYSHSMYIPILLSGIIFGFHGGLTAAIVGGLMLGPFMPVDILTGEAQSTANWLSRMVAFATVGGLAGWCVNMLKKQNQRIRWLAFHTPETGLPSKLNLIDRLDKILLEEHACVLVLHADNILEITNALGYKAGDQIISQLYERLDHKLPATTEMFHYHPDRLALVFPQLDKEDIPSMINIIQNAIKQSCYFANVPLYLNTYIGYIVADHNNETANEMVKKADIAMYYAKTAGLGYCEYSNVIDVTNKETLELLGSLLSAMESGQMRLYYQPKVDLNTMRVVGAEALVRWSHPTKGLIPPGKFIPNAEKTELINLLTNWAVKTSVKQMHEWNQQGVHIKVAVNVAARNLQHPKLYGTVTSALIENEISSEQLEIEVTESEIMKNPDAAIKILKKFKETGIIIAIDDFGTGYSSLAYLDKMPVNVIKIDQSFIKELINNGQTREIVKSTIDLSHKLNFKVIAEGIENRQTYDMLTQMGCDWGQGYYLAKPLTATDFFEMAKNHTLHKRLLEESA